MNEVYFPLKANDVKPKAEELRKKGHAMEAVSLVRNILAIKPEDFPRLTQSEQTLMLMAARIYVGCFNSLANRATKAPEVAAHLHSSKTAISQIYHNPYIEEAVPSLKKDIDGDPYEFASAMARDEANYLLILANLTGNSAFVEAAVQKLTNAVKSAEEPSEQTLAQFERYELNFKKRTPRVSFFTLTSSYELAVFIAQKNKNWERIATIAARYAIDAWQSGHKSDALKAAKQSILMGIKDPSAKTIFFRQLLENATKARRVERWRKTTPPGKDYGSELQIP